MGCKRITSVMKTSANGNVRTCPSCGHPAFLMKSTGIMKDTTYVCSYDELFYLPLLFSSSQMLERNSNGKDPLSLVFVDKASQRETGVEMRMTSDLFNAVDHWLFRFLSTITTEMLDDHMRGTF